MNQSQTKKGEFYRHAADFVTYGRTAIGTIFALNIISGDRLLPKKFRHRSVGSAVSLAALGAMDKIDGILARKADANGVSITKEDKEKDPIEDKKFTRRMMGAIAIREAIGGLWNNQPSRMIFSGLIATNLIATEDRDSRMNESRINAVEGADTGAIKINKYKTGLQNVGHSLATSPIAHSYVGQLLIGGVYTASTVMGEVGFKIADRIHRGEGPITQKLANAIDFEPL